MVEKYGEEWVLEVESMPFNEWLLEHSGKLEKIDPVRVP